MNASNRDQPTSPAEAGSNGVAAFFDLDGTLYQGYVWQAIYRQFRRNHFQRHYLYLYLGLHIPLYPLMRLGLLSDERFYRAWGEHMAWVVRGVSVAVAQPAWRWVVEEEIALHLRPSVLEALEAHRRQGHRLVLLSGTYQPVLKLLQAHLGAQAALATTLEVVDGRYSGRIVPPLNVGKGKLRQLQTYLAGPGKDLDLSRCAFYTDSIVDAPVLALFGRPVAVAPDEQLSRLAQARGWQIIDPPS